MPNVALAYQVLDFIEAHPKLWDQNHWVTTPEMVKWRDSGRPYAAAPEVSLRFETPDSWDCGTAACFAGWTVLLSGEAVTVAEDGSVFAPPFYLPSYAKRLLAVGEIDGLSLFDPSNDTFEKLAAMVEAIFGPRPTGAER